MGRPVGRNLEEEMIVKIKRLFDKVLDSVNKENPNYCFDFEQFVDCFDENDHFTKRVFEFLVKETAQRYRASHPQSQLPPMPRQPVIHHYLQDGHTENTNNAENGGGSVDSGGQSALASGSSGSMLQHLQQLQQSSGLSSSSPPLTTAGIPTSGNHSTSPSLYPNTTPFGALRSLLASQNSRRRHVQRMLNDEHYAQQYRYASNPATHGSTPTASEILGMFEPHNRTFSWGEPQHSNTDLASERAMYPQTPVVRPRPRRPLERSNAIAIRPFMRSMERSMEQMGEHGFASFGVAAEALMDARSHQNEASSTAARTIGPTLTERRLARLARATELMRTASLRAQSQPPPSLQSQGSFSSSSSSGPQLREGSSPSQTRQQQQSAQSSPFLAIHPGSPLTPSQVSRPTAEDVRAVRPQYFPSPRTATSSVEAGVGVAAALSAVTSASASTSTPASASASASATGSSLPLHPLVVAYQEFQASTARDRAALRERVIAAAEAADSIAATSPDRHTDAVGNTRSASSSSSLAAAAGEDEDEHLHHHHCLPGIGLALPPESETAAAGGSLSPLSNRRRRTRAEMTRMNSPDIASDNSSAIISQAALQQQRQQQQHQQEQRQFVTISGGSSALSSNPSSVTGTATPHSVGVLPPVLGTSSTASSTSVLSTPAAAPSSSAHTEAGAEHSSRTTEPMLSTPTAREGGSSSLCDTTTTTTPISNHGDGAVVVTTLQEATGNVPGISLQQPEDHEMGAEADLGGNGESVGSHGGGVMDARPPSEEMVPPTPPSPNPNGNPMPTFRARRRSSINPADIVALARQLQASAEASSALGVALRHHRLPEEEEEEEEVIVVAEESGEDCDNGEANMDTLGCSPVTGPRTPVAREGGGGGGGSHSIPRPPICG